MSSKRILSQRGSIDSTVSPNKKIRLTKQNDKKSNYFYKLLQESGLTLKSAQEKCIISEETIHVVRNIKKNFVKSFDYPRNLTEFFANLEKECNDINYFKHYLYPNIVRITNDNSEEHCISDSVFKILLSVPILQNKLTDYIFEKAIDLAAESKCGPWIQMILRCFSSLDSITCIDKLATQLINLLDVTSEKMVRLEIITAIPDIIGDQEHNNVAMELSRILNEDHDLIPAILDCLSYLCLSDEQYDTLQKKTLHILMTLPKCTYFPNFVKFLLMPSKISDTVYIESVQGIRNALCWPTTIATPHEIATSQVLTAFAIRNSILSSKSIGNAWVKVIGDIKIDSDYKAINFIILIVLYSTTEERQKQVESLIKKQIKTLIFKEELLDEVFIKYKPILKDNLKNLMNLVNCLLKSKGDPLIESFASKVYSLMLTHLEDSCQTIVAELLQLGLDCQQTIMNILLILNNVALNNVMLLKPQSLQMLILLDRMDNMNLNEIRAVMNLLCALAYTDENSIIRDDIHMIIRKELGSSSPKIKIQGILAGIHAVKYLMIKHTDDDETAEFPDDVSYSSVAFLSEGDLREAAQIIELISRSTRNIPEMIGFFYDELANIIQDASVINKNFLSWLTDAVTNDLQQNFIVDTIENERIGELTLSMQYCLNSDSEMDETIAINIAGLTLQPKTVVNIGILSPLFQLVQTLHNKQHDGTLSTIDALLGCSMVMPAFDVDELRDLDTSVTSKILDCLFHCVNWFRELLNGFATQDDETLKIKILQRLLQVEQIESLIEEILLTCKISYKAPMCSLNINKFTGKQIETKLTKVQGTSSKVQKKSAQDESVLPDTAKSQQTQNHLNKSKLSVVSNLPLRELNLSLLHLLQNDLHTDDGHGHLTIKSFNFLLKCINSKIGNILVSKIKRKTFLSRNEDVMYDQKKADECAKSVFEVLPKLMEHLTFVTSYLDNHAFPTTQTESFMYTSDLLDYLSCLENIYNFFTIYLKWIGFKKHNNALLKSSLRVIVPNDENSNMLSLKDLLLASAKYLQTHEKYCLLLPVAISLIEFVKTIQDFSDNKVIQNIMKNMAHSFLSQQWKTPDGASEKGLLFNQSVDKLTSIHLINNEILALRNLSLQLTIEIKSLKSQKDNLTSLKCVNKGSFHILYRNLGTAVYESMKSRLESGLTNSEHLSLWKDIAVILKNMSDIAKTLENRNNLSVFFKKSVPVLKHFLSQGIPILQLQLKTETEEVLEILKILQQSTRFLQSLCCHSRLKKDKVLMSKVPYIRQLLETLIYKVKAALAANNCSEAFWMGNLKNKNIHGEIIATQQSVDSDENDEEEQFPADDDSEDSDEDMLNPDSRSVSDIV